MDLPKTFADRYEVIALLGEGGVGKVFKVHDILLDKDFALKVLHRESTELALARFQREAKAAGRLNHPNICKITDFGQDGEGSHYMVMEFLSGKNLAEEISEKRLEIDYVIQILQQICEGLAYAHKNGVIHRDLKPANVQILSNKSDSVQIKLLDFGMAGLIESDGKLTQTGVLVGSPLYMSPELIEGKTAGIQSDIYSFGCLWYELLQGQPPFRGASILETLSMHKNAEVPQLDSEIEIAPELNDLLFKCLSKQSQMRPQNVEEILKILKHQEEETETVESSLEAGISQGKRTNLLKPLLIAVSVLACISIFLIIQRLKPVASSLPAPLIKKQVQSETNSNAVSNTSESPLSLSDQLERVMLKFELLIDHNGYKTLKALDIEPVVDDDLKHLKKLGANRLVLRNCDQITGSGFKTVNDTKIESLDLMDTAIEDKNLIYLKNLPSLKSLELSSPKLTDAALPIIAELKNLQILDLDSNTITNNGLQSISGMTGIRKLTLRCDPMTFDWMNHVGSLPDLEELLLERIVPKGSLTQGLVQFPRLSFLKLSSKEKFDTEIIKALARSHIKHLYLEQDEISDEKMQAISEISTLKALHLAKSRVSANAIHFLSTLKHLNQLGMKQSICMSDDVVQAIAKLNLSLLDFSGSNLTDKQLPYLLANSKLKQLLIKGCSLSPEQVELFKHAFRSKWGRECKVKA
ncbi:MAG: protein kinase [Candidatus Melainabacteria bacterium]|nr:MAG: protein kinase [Candidatus Melainabacteria bacterium]